jgi:hypothetical protein
MGDDAGLGGDDDEDDLAILDFLNFAKMALWTPTLYE